MFSLRNKGRLAQGRLALGAVVVGASLALSGCASGNPLDPGTTPGGAGDTIVIGSQAYYSNEIIAEIYAQALEHAGFTVTRNFNIGQRDAYMPEIENGNIDLFPEYTGNLLQFYDTAATATASDEVYTELKKVLPKGLTVLNQSSATDQDSYNVTKKFSEDNKVTSLADLSGLSTKLILGGAPELEERPYGPKGLKDVYGATVSFQATGDTTVDALVQGVVNMADVYSADPRIQTDDLVTLADPKGLFLASNVVPLVNADVAPEIADVINAVSAALTPKGLVALNVQSTVDKTSSPDIAKKWLTENGLLK